MADHSTVLAQLLQLIPRHEFDPLANRHHVGRQFRCASRWSQLVALMVAQLSGRSSLRDIIENLRVQRHKLYHLGCRVLSRSNLARINEEKPYLLFEELFGKLLARAQAVAPRYSFRFKNRLYSLDVSVIDLCLSVFPWAKFRTIKGALKLHIGLNRDGFLPAFVTITDCKTGDVSGCKALKLPRGSIVAGDRGYNRYDWFRQLSEKGLFFATRLKRRSRYRVVERRKVNRPKGLLSDQTIEWTSVKARRDCPMPLRRICYRDPETGKIYYFLANLFHLSAHTIAEIYRQRWQVELFSSGSSRT